MRKTRMGAARKQEQRGESAGREKSCPVEGGRRGRQDDSGAGHAERVGRQPRGDGVFNADLQERSEGEDSDEVEKRCWLAGNRQWHAPVRERREG